MNKDGSYPSPPGGYQVTPASYGATGATSPGWTTGGDPASGYGGYSQDTVATGEVIVQPVGGPDMKEYPTAPPVDEFEHIPGYETSTFEPGMIFQSKYFYTQ